MGFSDSPVRAYAYARYESEDEEHNISLVEWSKGVELDDAAYQKLCHE